MHYHSSSFFRRSFKTLNSCWACWIPPSTMTTEPTLAQQRAVAYSSKPFAALSFLASIYVLQHLIKNPNKTTRMYHRLIGCMNAFILVQTIFILWGNWVSVNFILQFLFFRPTSNICTNVELWFLAPFECWMLCPQAVPEGTPFFAGASGTVQTCTVQGFFGELNSWLSLFCCEKYRFCSLWFYCTQSYWRLFQLRRIMHLWAFALIFL